MKRLVSFILAFLLSLTTLQFTAIAADPSTKGESGELDILSLEDSPEWVTLLKAAQDETAQQLLIVSCDGMDASTATLTMHLRTEDGLWKQILSAKAYVGRNGLCPDGERYEGCGKTPIGVYTFNMAFGTADDPGCTIPYTKVNRYQYWSGDQREGMCYNRMVDIRDLPGLDKRNSEHLISNREYKYCLNISFNAECTPGRGSAIFLHCAARRTRSTYGCVAVAEKEMKLIMKNVIPECIVIIDTAENLERNITE